MVEGALLSKKEAKRILRLSHFPECDLSDIWSLEFDLFGEQPLSIEMWESLKDDLKDYSSVAGYTKGSYSEGDLRSYKGEIFISLSDENTSEPVCKDDWGIADKFETACYNDFWNKYGLGEFLSRKLLLDSLTENVVNLTGNGLVVKRGQTEFIPADADGRSSYVNAQILKINRCLKRMNDYLRGDGATCFSDLDESESCVTTIGETSSEGTWEMY